MAITTELHKMIQHQQILNVWAAWAHLDVAIGSLFSKGNGKIYTVVLGFIIGLYVSKKISVLIEKKTTNRFIRFFV